LERLGETENIAGVDVGAGEYRFSDAAVTYVASGGRWLSGNVRFSHGGFYDGNITSIRGTAILRPNHHLLFDFSLQRNDITLTGQSFSADLVGARARYAYSTKLFASVFVQYNNSIDELVTNLRINLIHAPLSDVFLVYTERRNIRLDLLLDRVITAKVTRLLAF
jgi:hypothetical protein